MKNRCIIYLVDNILGVPKDLDVPAMFFHGEMKEMSESDQLSKFICAPSQSHFDFKEMRVREIYNSCSPPHPPSCADMLK